jgi:hypothetical protein
MSINKQVLVAWFRKFPVLIACTFISIVLLILLYLRSDLSLNQQNELNQLVTKGERLLVNVTNSSQLQEQLDFLTQANQAVKSRSLNPEGIAENLQYFYRLESEAGIKYRDLRPGARASVNKQSSYVPINFTVGIDGSFAQIISYLKRLEQGSVICRITSSTVSASNDNVSLTLNLDLLGAK